MLKRILVVYRFNNNLTCTHLRRFVIYRKFCKYVCLANEQFVDVVYGVGRDAVNGNNVVTLSNIEARLCKRRPQALAVRCARHNLSNLIIAALVLLEFCAKQTHRDTLCLRHLTRIHICVSAGNLGNHLSNYIVEIQTGLHIREKHCIFLFNGFPVYAVHVLKIETVPECTPNLIINLCPLSSIIYRSHKVLE